MRQKLKCFYTGVLLPVLFLLGCVGTVSASETRVYDDAGLFSAGQKAQLEQGISAMRSELNMDFVVVTTNDAGGKTATEYADDYYDNNGFGVGNDYSGVLFLIDMDNREAAISTTGRAINYLTDGRIENILDDAYEGLAEGDYAAAAKSFLAGAEKYIRAGVPNGQYQYDTETGKVTRYRSLEIGEIIFAAVASLLAAFLCCLFVWRKYRAKGKKNAYPFREKSRLTLLRNEDVFLNKSVSSMVISTSSGSGGSRSGGGSYGRSSTHRSSSGRSHGGGSRKF